MDPLFKDLFDFLSAKHGSLVSDQLSQYTTELLDYAIELYGYSARDVFMAVFDPRGARQRHAQALNNATYDDLCSLVGRLELRQSYPDNSLSHCLIAMTPIPLDPGDRFTVFRLDFKSPFIARKVMQRMETKEAHRVRDMYNQFRRIPRASALAEWCFEALARRALSSAFTVQGAQQMAMVLGHTESSDAASSTDTATVIPLEASPTPPTIDP